MQPGNYFQNYQSLSKDPDNSKNNLINEKLLYFKNFISIQEVTEPEEQSNISYNNTLREQHQLSLNNSSRYLLNQNQFYASQNNNQTAQQQPSNEFYQHQQQQQLPQQTKLNSNQKQSLFDRYNQIICQLSNESKNQVTSNNNYNQNPNKQQKSQPFLTRIANIQNFFKKQKFQDKKFPEEHQIDQTYTLKENKENLQESKYGHLKQQIQIQPSSKQQLQQLQQQQQSSETKNLSSALKFTSNNQSQNSLLSLSSSAEKIPNNIKNYVIQPGNAQDTKKIKSSFYDQQQQNQSQMLQNQKQILQDIQTQEQQAHQQQVSIQNQDSSSNNYSQFQQIPLNKAQSQQQQSFYQQQQPSSSSYQQYDISELQQMSIYNKNNEINDQFFNSQQPSKLDIINQQNFQQLNQILSNLNTPKQVYLHLDGFQKLNQSSSHTSQNKLFPIYHNDQIKQEQFSNTLDHQEQKSNSQLSNQHQQQYVQQQNFKENSRYSNQTIESTQYQNNNLNSNNFPSADSYNNQKNNNNNNPQFQQMHHQQNQKHHALSVQYNQNEESKLDEIRYQQSNRQKVVKMISENTKSFLSERSNQNLRSFVSELRGSCETIIQKPSINISPKETQNQFYLITECDNDISNLKKDNNNYQPDRVVNTEGSEMSSKGFCWLNFNVLQRNQLWLELKNKKSQDRQKDAIQKEMSQCSFKPQTIKSFKKKQTNNLDTASNKTSNTGSKTNRKEKKTNNLVSEHNTDHHYHPYSQIKQASINLCLSPTVQSSKRKIQSYSQMNKLKKDIEKNSFVSNITYQ